MKRKKAPSHPGGILTRLYLDPLNINVVDLARALKVSRKTVSKLVNERGAITPEMALRLSIAFDTTPHLWLNLQHNYDLWVAEQKSKDLNEVQRLAA